MAQIPANDNPCSATPIPVGSSCVYTNSTNLNATPSAGVPAPGCANYLGGDVWFSATVPASGTIIFDSNTGTMLNGAMAAYSGTCGSLTLINCNNNGSANGLMPALTLTGLTPGATIWVRFWSPGNNNNGTFSICASTITPCNPANSNSSCALADPFCAGATTNLCNTTNVPSLGGGGIYGCLGATPNPSFYSLNIATSGPIDLQISQTTTGGVGIDVDFVIWGPFASQAAMCASLSAGNIVDCSFSTAAIENATIPNAIAGQWYMFLVTNFSNLNGVILIDQTNAGNAGAGSTNCNIITASPGLCNAGTFTLNGTVQVASFPASGTLTVTTSCGGSAVINAPFSNNIPYSIPGLPACGQVCTVNAVFSAGGAPILLPTNFTATNCNTLTATPGACSAGQYIMSGTITANCLPATGTLTITSSCGGSIVYNPPFSSPFNWTLPPSSGNGGNCTITAVYSAAGAPVIPPITVQEPTCCAANVGTQTITVTNGSNTLLANGIRQVVLCPTGTVVINSNNNFVLPTPGCGGCIPGLMYAIYSSGGPTGPNPNVDPNWTGYYWTGSGFPGTNTQGLNTNVSGGCSPLFTFPSVAGFSTMNPSNNTFVFVPITADAINLPNHDNNFDGCFNIGLGVSVTYLNPISFNALASCAGTMSVEVNGGYPEFFSGTYSISNTGAGTISTATVSSGGNVVISGLTSGQTVSFTVTDGNGCVSTFSKVFTNTPLPAVSILPSSSTICSGGCVALAASVTANVPAGNSTFTNNSCRVIPDGGILAGNTGQVNTGLWVNSPINISDYCGVNWNTGQLIQVCININHTYVSDLNIFLQAPNGVILSLSSDDGNAGDNYTNTCFTGTAGNIIGSGGNNAAPFNGTYAPDGPGGFIVFNGTPVNGIWRLWIGDDTNIDAGTLLNWSITFANQNTYTYAWSPTTNLSATNILNPTACPIANTTYSLVVTNSCGCSSTATADITIVSPPVATFTYPTPICKNAGTNPLPTYTGGGIAGTFSAAPAGLNFVSTSTGEINLATTTSGTYTITNTIAAGGGCPAVTATFIIVINTAPALTISAVPVSATTCFGVTGVTLSVMPNTLPNYLWSPTASAGFSVLANPPTTTTYSVVGTAANGCTSSASILVNVSLPANAGTNSSINLCSNGTPINLFSSLGGTPQATGTWTGPSALTGGNLGTFNSGVNLAGTYTYTVIGTAPCPNATANVVVTIYNPSFTGISYPGAPFCSNHIGNVNPVITGVAGGSFSSSPVGLSMSGAGIITPSTSTPGTYTVTYQVPASGGCSSYNVTQTVVINALPAPPTLLPNPACSGVPINFVAGGGSLYQFLLNGISQGAPGNLNTITLGPLNVGDIVCVNSYLPLPINFNGLITEAEWGSPIATSLGGPSSSGFGANNNLDALYLKNSSGYFYGAMAGNVVNGSNNRLLLFIDCLPGGFNNLGAWVARSNAPYYSVENLNNITFDAGFTPEYILAMNQAGGNSFFDLYNMVTNTNNYLGDGIASPWLGFVGNASVGDYSKGFEFGFPMTALGNPTVSIKVFAMLVNNPGTQTIPNTSISNQFLTPCGPAELNYGNGVVNFAAALPNPILFPLSADCYSQTCVTIVNSVTPTFSFPLSLCSGTVAPILPLISDNGVAGTWSPTIVNNTIGNSYTFTPSGSCAVPVTINIAIVPNPTLSPLYHD
jgi:subtilisin-like proprotein convertase family protein